MNWKAYSLRLILTGDLHCGSLPLGFVSRTFPYIPCHIPVFAMVPAAVRALAMPDRHDSYAAVEALLSSCFRCTPLYVCNEKGIPLFPWEEKSLRELEYTHLSSTYGVALDSARRSAMDGCLYETEIILARGRNCTAPTVLTGAFFLTKGKTHELVMETDGTISWRREKVALKTVLSLMQIGGDRTRSLGRPAVPVFKPLEAKLWDKYSTDVLGTFPSLIISKGEHGPLPLECGNYKATGNRIVLTGRRHRGTGFGEDMDHAVIAFDAGWTSDSEIRASLTSLRCASASQE